MTGDDFMREAAGILTAEPADGDAPGRHAQRQLDALVQYARANAAYAQEVRDQLSQAMAVIAALDGRLRAVEATTGRTEDYVQVLRGPRRSLREFVGIAPTGVAE